VCRNTPCNLPDHHMISSAHFTYKEVEACQSPFSRWQGQDSNPVPSVSKTEILGSERTSKQRQGVQKVDGLHLKGTSRNPYLDHQKHESARGPRQRRCRQSLRPWKRDVKVKGCLKRASGAMECHSAWWGMAPGANRRLGQVWDQLGTKHGAECSADCTVLSVVSAESGLIINEQTRAGWVN
jgi:hypothetical protein